ncbi:hypothetical protein GWK47_005439 [Chionoecetes opilio]|uniref:Uncharacterized protein n=1 Tax=Chionoecetes opilio TaxID=41210 RepID=A0A8J4YIE5_CHIOP|nr:hypothetical protein GWK47_005439 [Chionoecetes opilio]
MATERLQLPSFHHNVQDWLLHVQATWLSPRPTTNKKLNAGVCALPTEVATLVQSTITSPPDSNRFAAIKSALLDVYRRPDNHHLQELQTITLGDMRPSFLWPQMQLINIRCNTSLPTAVLRSMFLSEVDLGGNVAMPALRGSTTLYGFVKVWRHYGRSTCLCCRIPRAETSGTPLRHILQRLDAIEERMNIRVIRRLFHIEGVTVSTVKVRPIHRFLPLPTLNCAGTIPPLVPGPDSAAHHASGRETSSAGGK